MKASILLVIMVAALPSFGGSEKVRLEWIELRKELRRQGYPVAAFVETPEQIAADMRRVRREMERRGGRPFVSDLQRVGGGGGGASPRTTARTPHKKPQGARGLK